jgi:hypothetical protein
VGKWHLTGSEGVYSTMWDNTNENTDVDCDLLKVAAKIGIIGAFLMIAWNLIYTIIFMYQIETGWAIPNFILVNNLSAFAFIGSIFTAVGFVAIFSMKQNKLGFFFPLMVVIQRFAGYLYVRIAFALSIYSAEFHVLLGQILGYVATVIGGLLLLSIRKKSKNSQFLSIFAIIYMLVNILAAIIWYVIFRGPFPVTTGFDYLITSLPTLVTGITVSILTIVFFVLESQQGCIDEQRVQETPFLE